MTPEWIKDLRRRAAAGDGEALAFTAVLAALGAWEPASWQVAMDRLEAAAQAGFAPARAQQAVIGALEPWLTPAPRARLKPDLRISTAAGFLPQAACAWLIERAGARLAPAQVFGEGAAHAEADAGRTNSAFAFGLEDLDLVVLAARARIAATVGVPAGALEPIQVLHYAPGQSFARHYDFLDPEVPAFAAEIGRTGQRMATFLVYLNDGYEGGETDFPLVGLRHKGAAGDALMFANLEPAGAPDRRMLHAGLPTRTGEKWVLSQWIRDRAAG